MSYSRHFPSLPYPSAPSYSRGEDEGSTAGNSTSMEWSLKRIDSSSYYKKEKITPEDLDKGKIHIEVRNPRGRIVRACTVYLEENSELRNQTLDLIHDLENQNLNDTDWKIKYQRPLNTYRQSYPSYNPRRRF